MPKKSDGVARSPQLGLTRERQKAWSLTADRLKGRHELIRRLCFGLSIIAALLAAVASQLPDLHTDPSAGSLRLKLSVVSAAFLATVAFMTMRYLGGQNVSAWMRARAASEALKRMAFTFAARAIPYDNQITRESLLENERSAVESQVKDLLRHVVSQAEIEQALRDEDTKKRGLPQADLSRADHTSRRLKHQKDWYAKKADQSVRAAKLMRAIEFALALLATVITGVVGVINKQTIVIESFGIGAQPFDLIALTGVLTTLSGAILAYIEASRLDFIVTSYRAAARQLDDLFAKAEKAQQGSAAEWSAFVDKVEDVIAIENGTWMTRISSDGPQSQPVATPT